MRGWYRVAATAMVGGGLFVATGPVRAADATHLYLSDDGEIAGGTDNHALNHGVRVTC